MCYFFVFRNSFFFNFFKTKIDVLIGSSFLDLNIFVVGFKKKIFSSDMTFYRFVSWEKNENSIPKSIFTKFLFYYYYVH